MGTPSAALLALATLSALAPAAPGASPEDRPVRLSTLDGMTVEGTRLTARESRVSLKVGADERLVDLADLLELTLGETGEPPLPLLPGKDEGPEVEAEFPDRDRVPGILVRGLGETGFVVRTRHLGELEIPLEHVATVRFPAAYRSTEDPAPLAAGEKADRVLFTTGDRLDGTVRSLDATSLRLRSTAGVDRSLPLKGLLGFSLLPLGERKEEGLRVAVVLRDGSVFSGTGVTSSGAGILLEGMYDGKARVVPLDAVLGMTVRGGNGTPLSDLAPASVEVKPYWGDGPAVFDLSPRFDRAFDFEQGPPGPLRLGGRTWLRGISMFSGTTMTWNLEGRGFSSFTASVGVDDAGPRGAVEFEVLLDGKSAWRSGVVRGVAAGAEPTALPPLDVSKAKSLALRVHAGPDDDVQDFADWVRAALVR